MKPIQFAFYSGIGTLLIAGLSSYILQLVSLEKLILPSIGMLFWVFILTAASYTWVYPSLNAPGAAFMNRVLGITMLRLLLGIALVLLLLFLYPDAVLTLVLLFFFYYSAGLAFEIFQLLRNLRDISK
jgi:hypothetical protein